MRESRLVFEKAEVNIFFLPASQKQKGSETYEINYHQLKCSVQKKMLQLDLLGNLNFLA